jgi:hypothetical protein
MTAALKSKSARNDDASYASLVHIPYMTGKFQEDHQALLLISQY